MHKKLVLHYSRASLLLELSHCRTEGRLCRVALQVLRGLHDKQQQLLLLLLHCSGVKLSPSA
jgi:hypothetical protein